MLDGQETRRVAAALIEQFGEVTLAAAIHNARSASERGDLVAMLEWQSIAREALRQMPVEALSLA